jgi:hypothetical protein
MSKTATAEKAAVKYEQHPIALQVAPGEMPEEEFDAFCADIGKRGQQHPIVLFEKKVLDGKHRLKACTKLGITPIFKEYTGDDPAGLVVALNVLRRRLGTTQRALAGARLNMDYNMSQDEASKRVGVSKVHINLVAQALKSNNARVIKMLENPDLTRAALHEELVDSGVVRAPSSPVAASTLSAAGAATGLESWARGGTAGPEDEEEHEDDDLLGGGDENPDLDDVLGAPPTAGGKVLPFATGKGETTPGGMPTVGARPGHPERRNRDTPAYQLAEKFKGLTEGDKLSFMQLTWHLQRPLISAAGLSANIVSPSETKVADAKDTKPLNRADREAAAKAAKAALDKAATASEVTVSNVAKGNKAAKGAKPASPTKAPKQPATATAGAAATPTGARARKAA